MSNQKGEKSTIKVLIDEIIKEIGIRHGLASFPAREEQEELLSRYLMFCSTLVHFTSPTSVPS